MPQLDASRLRKWADELDAEERAEKEAALEDKVSKLEEGQQSDEKDRQIAELQAKLAALEAADTAEQQEQQHAPAPEAEEATIEEEEREPLTRPGRKSGAAYDWYIGEDGQVVQSDTAIVYSGEDEPESVAL